MKDKANKVKVWIARDKNGSLYAYAERPVKSANYWGDSPLFILNGSRFPSVKWEDDEPTEAYITLAESENKSSLNNRTLKKRLASISFIISYAKRIIEKLKK